MELKFCDKCGRELVAQDSAFCAYCGAPVLRSVKPESPPHSATSPGSTPKAEAQSQPASDTTEKLKSDRQEANDPATSPDEIRKLANLRAQGVLSAEEFAAALATVEVGKLADLRARGILTDEEFKAAVSLEKYRAGIPTTADQLPGISKGSQFSQPGTTPEKLQSTQQPHSSTSQVANSGPGVADEPRFVDLRVKTPWMRHPLSKDWLFWVAIAVLFFSIGPLVNTLSSFYPEGFSNVGVGAAFLDALFILIPLPTVLIGAIAVVRRLVKKNDFLSRLKTPPVDQNKGWKSDPLEVGFERWWTGDAWTANIKRYEALGMGWPAAGTLIVFFVCYWFTFLLFS